MSKSTETGSDQALVSVEWEHPTTCGRRQRSRIYLREGESAAAIIAGSEGLSDRVIVHSIVTLESGVPCACDGSH